jgi:hypothetical protein
MELSYVVLDFLAVSAIKPLQRCIMHGLPYWRPCLPVMLSSSSAQNTSLGHRGGLWTLSRSVYGPVISTPNWCRYVFCKARSSTMDGFFTPRKQARLLPSGSRGGLDHIAQNKTHIVHWLRTCWPTGLFPWLNFLCCRSSNVHPFRSLLLLRSI